jgi:dihydroneopterin aldolase
VDKIYLHKMEFYGYHGVFPEENRLGQRFIVDLAVETDLRRAGGTDRLADSVNYEELYRLCRTVVEENTFRLIEAVAETIARHLLEKFPAVKSCTVTVTKPNPPIAGHVGSVAVEITRTRDDLPGGSGKEAP